MGVIVRLVVYATDETAAVNACKDAFKRIALVDDVASDYRKASEISNLTSTAATRPIALSDDLWLMIVESQKVARLTDGHFDITCSPMVQLWRKARKEKQLPDPNAIADAKTRVGYEKLHLNPQDHSIKFAVAGMKLDLGAVAKGYAMDKAIETLRANGIRSALCEAGGDIVVSDPPPGRDGWNIAIADAGVSMPEEIALRNCAISTSGDTEQFVVIDGKHYSHVVDARTGIGLTTRRMATVIAPCGFWSDILSTAATLVDEPQREKLLKEYPGVRAHVRTVK